MKEVLHAMGIRTIEQEGLEADDLLGTLSKRCERIGMEVVIISGDRDLLQLATDHVEIRIPKTKRTGTEIENYYAVDVKEKYQVTPTEFIDVKALMGDTSDNIPGVPGVGEKTATKIIVEYGSIENAYKHASELKPPRASKNLLEYWDQAQMSKVLATIDVDADFAYELEEAKLGNLYTAEVHFWYLCKERLPPSALFLPPQRFSEFLLFPQRSQMHLGLMIDPKTELEKMVCYEAYAAFASSAVLEEKLKKEKMWKLFTEIEMPLVFTLFHKEQNGVRVEAEELKSKERCSMGINGVSSYANTYTYGNVKPSKNSEKNYYAGYTMNSANKFKNVSDYSKYLTNKYKCLTP